MLRDEKVLLESWRQVDRSYFTVLFIHARRYLLLKGTHGSFNYH